MKKDRDPLGAYRPLPKFDQAARTEKAMDFSPDKRMEFYGFMKGATRKQFEERGDVHPMVIAVLPDQSEWVAFPDMGDANDPAGEAKSQASFDRLALAMRFLATEGAFCMCYVFEAWMLGGIEAQDDEDVKETVKKHLGSGGRIKDHPQRQESLHVSYFDPDNERMSYAPIFRSEDGTPTLGDWKEFEKKDLGRLEGRFANIYGAYVPPEDSLQID